MKIFHISSASFNGGAARAGYRLHLGLQHEVGIESKWIDTDRQIFGNNIVKLPLPSRGQALMTRLRRRRWSRKLSQDFAATSAPASNPIGWGSVELLDDLPLPDIWNLHWVSWFLNWETMLPWMAERAPIVWTLHDLNPLKGIWHYEPLPEECSPQRMRLEEEARERKRRALARVPRDRLTFVGPSRWIVECCKQSPVTCEFPVHHIPYGLDTETYAPQDGNLLRSMLAIPSASFVLGFIAADLQDPRKGMEPFQAALRHLARDHSSIHLVTVGNGEIDSGGLPHIHLGPLHNDRLLSYFYSACDLFVCPSLQDNLPNTVLESIACDTPVVAFDVGGLPDMVHEGKSGFLVKPVGDGEALHTSLASRIEAPSNLKMLRGATREWATQRYSLELQSRHYSNLYQRMLAGNGK